MDEPGRLDSWKQIAAHLGRSERTVRRWQEVEGLPVHRHLHLQRGSVWAYRAELDAWLEGRRLAPEPVDAVLAQTTPRQTRRLSIALVLTTVGVLILGSILWRRQMPAIFPEAAQITALPGAIYGPAFSPDGRRIVFHWSPTENRDSGLYVKNIGDETVLPLMPAKRDTGEFVYGASWSPDGKTIAFLRRVAPQPGFTMYATASQTYLQLIAASGGPERSLIRLAKDVLFYANSTHLSWTRDSQSILAPMADGSRKGIFQISVINGEAHRLTPGIANEFAPSLSPDGRALVFMRQEGPAAASIERVLRQDLSAEGDPVGQPREVFSGRSMSSGIAWMPSGKELIFCTADSAFYGPFNSRLYRMSAEAKRPLSPLGFGVGCSTVAVSRPDTSGLVDVVYASGENTKGNLFQANLDRLDEATKLVPSSRFDALPSYSPDGSLIAFVSNRAGHPELWLTRRDGTSTTKLTEGSNIASTPRWSADGSRLVYGSAAPPNVSTPYAISIIPIAGGVAVSLPIKQPAPSDPSWSPSADWIYYWSGTQLWRARPSGEDAVQVGDYPAHFVRPGVSDDGQMFYTRASEPFALCRTALDNSKQEVLTDGLLTPFFAFTKRYIYYLRRSDQSLYAMPIPSGTPRRIGEMPQLKGLRRIILGMSVSSDDARIVWAVTGEQQLDLNLVSKFR